MDDTSNKSGSENRQRRKLIALRVSDAEFVELVRRAEAVQLSVAAYIRMQSIAAPAPRASRRPAVETVELARVLAELGKIGSNVNQIARVLNASGTVEREEIADAMQAVADIRAAVMEALGRA